MRNSRLLRKVARAALLALSIGLVSLIALSQQRPLPSASAVPLRSSAPSTSGSVAPSSASAAPSASAALLSSAEVPPEPLPSAAVPEAPAAVEVPVEPPPAAPSASPFVAPPTPSVAVERSEAAPVRIGDSTVFSLYSPDRKKPPEERARAATKALTGVLESKGDDTVRVSRQGEAAVVLVAQTPIVQLTDVDAKLAGDSSLEIHAANVAAAVRRGIDTERRRSAVAKTVFSVSLVVFFALIAFYLMRKVGEFADKARAWVDEHGEKSLRVRVRDIELLSPATAQSTAVIALSLGRWLGQFGIFYAWLVVVLSLFEATKGYTERLTGFVVQPLSQMMGRIATSLPLLVVLLIAGLSVFVLVRFAGLFFRSIERRETAVPWLPAELAGPTSVIVRVVIILGAIVLAGPVVTGDDSGALARVGMVAIAALGLSCVPILANALLGAYVVFARRLRLGQHVEIAGRSGRIAGLDLMEVRLEDAARSELRFPHLFLLQKPTRVFGIRPRVFVEVAVAPDSSHARVRDMLEQAASKIGRDARIELVGADAAGIVYRVSSSADTFAARSELQVAVLDALREEGIKLGLAPRVREDA